MNGGVEQASCSADSECAEITSATYESREPDLDVLVGHVKEISCYEKRAIFLPGFGSRPAV
jgi:hypothetical protein